MARRKIRRADRRRPQRPGVRLLPGPRRLQRHGVRAPGVVGGAAVTEEFHPGFRNSVASYTVSLLNPKVIRDMRLARAWAAHRRAADVEFPAAGRRRLSQARRRAAKTQAEMAQILEARRRAIACLSRHARSASPTCCATSCCRRRPAAGGGVGDVLGCASGRAAAARSRRTARRAGLFTKSAGDLLDGWFESDRSRPLRLRRVVGNFASPYAPGSAYVLLHHCFGEVNGKRGNWGHAIGGMGAITQAMARAGSARRGNSTDARSARSAGGKGRARGVRARGRAEIAAKSWPRTSIRACCTSSSSSAGDSTGNFVSAHRSAIARLGDLPHERGAVGIARFPLPARQHGGQHHAAASSWRRRSPTWSAPTHDARATAGRASPSSKC